ncbi:MAG: CHASE2 domain-containing protein [Bacteroidetes bacterium]|nr:MAG: CHASE2 domain-containing protein [Bacteroidota bacterium]
MSIFKWVYFFGTLTIFLAIFLIQRLAVNVNVLSVFEKALHDYNITDLAFSKFRPDADSGVLVQHADTSIVIVNFGASSNVELAQLIEIINQYEPKVIAINKVLTKSADSHEGDSILTLALGKVKNLVLLSTLKNPQEDKRIITWDSLNLPIPIFKVYGQTGFGKIVSSNDEQFDTWRTVESHAKLKNGQLEACFAGKIAEMYDSTRANFFYERGNIDENINFTGNLEKFAKLDIDNVFSENFTPESVKGKIVLFGYLGDEYTSTFWDGDKFYTPLNEKQIGRTTPDMYSVVIHANIVAMILNGNYINEVPFYVNILIAFIFCYVNVVIFTYIGDRFGFWGGIMTKVIQLIETVGIVYIILLSFTNFHLKLDLTLLIFVGLLSGDALGIYQSLIVNTYEKLAKKLLPS